MGRLRVVLIGAAGQLGSDLARTFDLDGELVALKHQDLDLLDATRVGTLLAELRPTHVVNTAAYNRVDQAEADRDAAFALNARAVGDLAAVCQRLGATLVHFSTDYVFDGRSETVVEESTPNPINVYGRSKLAGERNVLGEAPDALVVRTCANFGWNRLRGKENNVTWILNALRTRKTVPLFTDQRVSPSYVPHVARLAFDLLEKEESGVYHAATKGCLTRYEIGEAVCDTFGLPTSLLKAST